MCNLDGSWKQFASPAEYLAAQRAWLARRYDRNGARSIRDAVEGVPVGGSGSNWSRGTAMMGGRAPINASRSSTSSSTTTIGQITVHTAATDAGGIARDLGSAIRDRGLVVQSGSGMVP